MSMDDFLEHYEGLEERIEERLNEFSAKMNAISVKKCAI